MDKYRDVQKYVIYRQEQDFCKDTEIFLEIEKKMNTTWDMYEKLHENYMNVNHLKLKEIRENPIVVDFFKEQGLDSMTMTKKEICTEMKIAYEYQYNRYRQYHNSYHNCDLTQLNDVDANLVKKHNKDKTLCPCPVSTCRGFIRSMNNCCGTCDTEICRSCFVIKTQQEEHECNPADVETVKMILKESKPCPRCGTRICKTTGCDQMYCTECKTAFSWKTGAVEQGRIHNPHYYEQLRQAGVVPEREPGDRPGNCDDEPRYIFHEYVEDNKCTNVIKLMIRDYNNMVRAYLHNNYCAEEIEPDRNTTPFKANFKTRIQYLKNQINEEQFKTKLYREFKKRKYENEIHTELTSYLNTVKTLLLTYNEKIKLFTKTKVGQLKNVIVEIRNLRKLYLKLSADLVKTLKSTGHVYNYKSLKTVESLQF